VIGQGGEEGMQWVRVIDGALQEWEAKHRTDGAPSGNQNAAREKTTGCVTPSCFGDRDNQYKQVGGTSSDTGSSSSVTESCFRDDESARGIRRLARDAPDILERKLLLLSAWPITARSGTAGRMRVDLRNEALPTARPRPTCSAA